VSMGGRQEEKMLNGCTIWEVRDRGFYYPKDKRNKEQAMIGTEV